MEDIKPPYRLSDLIDGEQLRLMAEACYKASGLATSIIDARDKTVLVGVGWQDICAKFHRPHPLSGQRCLESVLALQPSDPDEYEVSRCKNGLRHVGIPMFIEGTHVATFYLTQFLLDTDGKDVEFFRRQASEWGFDQQEYLQALEALPVLTRERIDTIVEYTRIFSRLMATLAENTLRLRRENAARERVQTELRDRVAFTEQLIEVIANPVFIKDNNGIYTGCNAAFSEFIGFGREELLGKGVYDLYGKDEAEVYYAKDAELMARGGVQVYDFTLHTRQGEARDVQFSKAVTYDSSRAVSGIIGIITDLTERKRSEKALQQSEEQFRFLAEHSVDIIWRLDAGHVITYVSPADKRMRGYPEEEVLGRSFFDLVHAD